MDKNLLIEIFIPTRDGKGHLASGYPVAKDRILTARHVLSPAGRTDPSAPIQLRWHHQTGAARNWQLIKESDIVWDGGANLDAALIYCPFPVGVSDYGFPSTAKPRDGTLWVSEGFPRVGEQDEHSRKAIAMQGKCFSMADRPNEFELGSEFSHDIPDGWKGVSGCPVFVDGAIIGVIKSCPHEFNQRRLSATPMWKLLKEEDFCRKINYHERQWQKLSTATAELTKTLVGSSDAIKAIAAEINEPPDRPAGYIAEKLLSLTDIEFISATTKAYRSLRAKNLSTVAEVIRDVIDRSLPAIYQQHLIETILARRANVHDMPIMLLVRTEVVAEILMAGVDQRAMICHPTSDPLIFPRGEYVVPVPPDCGRSIEDFKDAWHNHMVGWLASQFTNSDKFETLKKIAADELTYMSESEKKTYYCLFFCRNEKLRPAWHEVLRSLKAQYPAIVFLSLDGDEGCLLRETRLFRPLRELWARSSGANP